MVNMNSISLAQLIPTLQVAIGPVILISGVALLLLVLTNRFGRAIDRARALQVEFRGVADGDRQALSEQVKIIFLRARLIRASIALAGLSVLFAAILIVTLFLTALMHWEVGILVSSFFVLCMVSLIGSVATFIVDVQLALKALKIELRRATPEVL